jgi:hypothetical protein
MNMKSYSHTQKATSLVLFTSMIGVGIAIVAAVTLPLLFIPAAIVLLAAWNFHSLRIEIEDGELRWRFGPGWIRRRVRLADIESVKIVRTSFLEGWGIHYSRFGWLYNVSGFDAVAITLRNGKRFCLGTDEPQVLARELESDK